MSAEEKADEGSLESSLRDAVTKAAIGGSYRSKRVVQRTNFLGETSETKTIDQRDVPPNGRLLEMLMQERCGGPHDWC